MQPPYELNSKILDLVSLISEQVGAIKATYLIDASPKLRKQNQTRTIPVWLAIEGNTLSKEQITAIINHKRVLGPAKDILEVSHAIKTYEDIQGFKYLELKSFLRALRN